ncbi:probable glutamate receptor [Macrobrachium rosenbergii]|uniref:probable glutamate receptor n=1 Tax=Macrobrachium rosenbergii TaxID=79674 RepID=UPI0034D7B452
MALSGKHLRVAAGVWDPWVLMEHDLEGRLVKSTGIFINFMDMFAQKLNFTYSIAEAADGEWGRILPNGSTTGMIGLCQRREVDMALGPFSITYLRSLIIDFSIPVYIDNEGIFLPRPTLERDLTGFAKPFSWQVWIALSVAVLGSMVLGVAMRRFVHQWGPVRLEHGLQEFHGKTWPLLTFEPIWLIRLLLLEAAELPPMMLTGQLFMGTWMLATLILSSAYQGVLTSLLAIPKVEIPVDSLQDLVNYGKIPWANERGTSLHQFFGDAKSGIYKVINDKAFLITASYDERHRMKVEKFAILCDFFSMKKIMSDDYSETGQCNYYIAKEPIVVSSYAFAFPKNSSIIPHFNKLVTMLKEGGIINRYSQEFTSNATACMVKPGKEEGVSTLVLSLGDFGGVFLLCLGGMCLSNLPHRTISQPYPGTYDIMPTHHESTSPVLVTALQKVIMMLYGNTSALSASLRCTVQAKAAEYILCLRQRSEGSTFLSSSSSVQAALARLSTMSFPASPIWEGIHMKDKTSEAL